MSGEQLCACGCGRPVWRWLLAENEAQMLAGLCLGKTRFASQKRASACARSHQHTYPCPICDHWHNGSAVHFRDPKATAKRTAVLDRLRANGNAWIIRQLAAGFAAMDRTAWKNRGRHTPRGRAAS